LIKVEKYYTGDWFFGCAGDFEMYVSGVEGEEMTEQSKEVGSYCLFGFCGVVDCAKVGANE
jgi:hypothetical protein